MVRKALTEQFGADKFEVRRIESVGPQIGEDLRFRGTMSVIVATVMMGIYIWIRFGAAFGARFGLLFRHRRRDRVDPRCFGYRWGFDVGEL